MSFFNELFDKKNTKDLVDQVVSPSLVFNETMPINLIKSI